MDPNNQPRFSSGRTVKVRNLQYLRRQADEELFEHCRNGRASYILHSPQMGKSSLIAHTAQRLTEESHHPIIIDLSQFPLPPLEEEWFLRILFLIDDELDLSTDTKEWWDRHTSLPPHERLTQFIANVVLPETSGSLVLFIDEIERTLTIPFQTTIFDWLAALQNSRTTNSDFNRITFVLCGVATPSQLIPVVPWAGGSLFQWSHQIVLSEFTLEEALPLAQGLSLPDDTGLEALKGIYRWTSGHPYLTQLFCQVIEEQNRSAWSEAEIDECLRHYLKSPQGLQDRNIQLVQAALTDPGDNGVALLQPYFDLLKGQSQPLKRNPAALDQLLLAGILREEEGEIAIRNKVYEEVFNLSWVKRHIFNLATPVPFSARIPYLVAASLLLFGVGYLLGLFRIPTFLANEVQQMTQSPEPSKLSQALSSRQNPTPGQAQELIQSKKNIRDLEATLTRYQQLKDEEVESLKDQRTQLESQMASQLQDLEAVQVQKQELETALLNQRSIPRIHELV